MFDLSKKRWQWAALLSLALIWGSSFILMKRGLQAFSFIQVAAIRNVFAFSILLPVAIKSFNLITRENIKSIAIVGFAGIFFPSFLFTLAQTKISSSLAGMLNSASPLFALIVGLLFYKSKPLRAHTVGIIMGFVGAILLITNGRFDSLSNINLYAVFVIVATFGYGINANEVRYKLGGLSGIQITALSFLVVGIPALIVLLSTNLQAAYNSVFFWESLAAVLVLSAFGSVISLFVYNNLIHKTSALFATSVTYVIPIFAIIWGVVDGELIGNIQLAGITVVLLGVYLVNVRNYHIASQLKLLIKKYFVKTDS